MVEVAINVLRVAKEIVKPQESGKKAGQAVIELAKEIGKFFHGASFTD